MVTALKFTDNSKPQMDHRDIQTIINKHCRIKLKSGKEIFGVLFNRETETDLYFSSYADLVKAGKENLGYIKGNKVNIDEVVLAEPIEE